MWSNRYKYYPLIIITWSQNWVTKIALIASFPGLTPHLSCSTKYTAWSLWAWLHSTVKMVLVFFASEVEWLNVHWLCGYHYRIPTFLNSCTHCPAVTCKCFTCQFLSHVHNFSGIRNTVSHPLLLPNPTHQLVVLGNSTTSGTHKLKITKFWVCH